MSKFDALDKEIVALQTQLKDQDIRGDEFEGEQEEEEEDSMF